MPEYSAALQRYGWDLAARQYETLWQHQLAPAHEAVLALAQLAPGESVLDLACGTGLVSLAAARQVGPAGSVCGVDISGDMVAAAAQRAEAQGIGHAAFARMDGECLDLADARFDVVLCALGLMYMPDPAQALREMRRVLRPGGRLVLAVWGERAQCAWSAVFPIVDAEVSSDVCPLFFQLGHGSALADLCAATQFTQVATQRLAVLLDYANASQACQAAFVGGPAALAWSRFTDEVRERVCARYVEAIASWRLGDAFRLPGQFVVTRALAA